MQRIQIIKYPVPMQFQALAPIKDSRRLVVQSTPCLQSHLPPYHLKYPAQVPITQKNLKPQVILKQLSALGLPQDLPMI